MTAFYEEMQDCARMMIREFGRDVTFVKTSEVPLDPSQPWKGVTTDEETLVLQAVFVPPNQIRQFGLTALGLGTEFDNLITYSQQIAIVNSGDEELRSYSMIRDSQGIDWSLVGVQRLKPGTVGLISYIGVRR